MPNERREQNIWISRTELSKQSEYKGADMRL